MRTVNKYYHCVPSLDQLTSVTLFHFSTFPLSLPFATTSMAQLRFLLVTVALVAMTSLPLLALVSAQPVAPDHAKQMENIANLAEKMSDRQREKYCERFGEKIASRVDVWPTIMTECIDKLVFDRSNAHLPENFPVSFAT